MQLNSKLQLVIFFISMVMLTACGGGGDDSEPRPATPRVTPAVTPAVITSQTSQSLEGSWSTACQKSKGLDGYDEQDIFNFKGNTRTTTKFFYLPNTNCKHSEEVLREREVAGIELGKVVNPGTSTEHTKINITTTKVILAPMNSTLTALLNNTGHTSMQSIYNGYGLTDWDRYYWKDLSSIDAAKNSFKITKVVPDIFQISDIMDDGTTDKVLKLGVQGGNLDSDGRPISLAKKITAFMQNKTIEQPEQTQQNAGLIGEWYYPCRRAKGAKKYLQRKLLEFTGNNLKTLISFYPYSTNLVTGCFASSRLYRVYLEADIVLGKVINKGGANEHTEIGIKTTKAEISLEQLYYNNSAPVFNAANFYNTEVTNLYYGYGQTGWKSDAWKDISDVPNAITNLNIGTQVPDIFKISTVTTDEGDRKDLKMGDYKGRFDINGRAMSLEPEAAVRVKK